MLESVAGRARRPLLAILSVFLVAGIGVSLYFGHGAGLRATTAAARSARLAAQLDLAPMLTARDLEAPVTGTRYYELSAQIKEGITSAGPIDGVRIWSSSGRILYDGDQRLVGTHPTYIHDLAAGVTNGSTQSFVEAGVLKTYVPLWLEPGGTVVIAQMDQASGPIVSRATRSWYRLALGLAVGLLLALVVLALSFRLGGSVSPSPAAIYAPQRQESAPSRAPAPRAPAAKASAPVYVQPGFREAEETRRVAEERARALEDSIRGLQGQYQQALEQIKTLEAQVQVRDTTSSHTEGELRTLRDQVRDTAERLHQAEIDGAALRERLALRQSQLEQAEGEAQTARERLADIERDAGSAPPDIEPVEPRRAQGDLPAALRDLGEADGEADGELARRILGPADAEGAFPAAENAV